MSMALPPPTDDGPKVPTREDCQIRAVSQSGSPTMASRPRPQSAGRKRPFDRIDQTELGHFTVGHQQHLRRLYLPLLRRSASFAEAPSPIMT
jgi:hypothetical protein